MANDVLVPGVGGDYLPVRQLQEALTVWFGSHAMSRTCGPHGCDGQWGAETEWLLNELIRSIGSAAGTDHVTERYLSAARQTIWLPWGLHNWVTQESSGYQVGRNYPGAMINQSQQAPITPVASAGALPWFLGGAVLLLVGGGVYWKWGRRR